MNSNPIALWLIQAPDHPGTDGHVGELLFARARVDTTSPKGIRLALKPILSQTFLTKHRSLRWVGLRAEISSQKIEPRMYGRVFLDPHERSHQPGMPQFEIPGREIEWNWFLLPEDLERIERDRSDAKGSPLNVKVTADGVIQTDSGMYMVRGEGNLEIALSDWESYLKMLGYNLPPSAAELAGLAAVDHPTWKEAAERLAPARVQVRAGEGRVAMMSCLREFERVVTAPYNRDSWKGRYAVPDQKEDGLVAMLAGHCTYLNKVGYHRSRQDRDPQGGLVEMPVDQWEAELAVGVSQFWLTYALRLAMSPIPAQ